MTQAALVYGGSLYDLAAEEKCAESILDQMQQILQILKENPEYITLITTPSIPKQDRNKLIDDAFGTSVETYLTNFMKLLCDKGYMHEFADCCEAFKKRYNEDHNIVEAVVTTVVALNEDQMKRLQEKLEKVSGKHVQLSQRINPDVIGGLSVEMEGRQMDGTVKGRLNRMSRTLNEIIV